jgi:hypothetical protein
MYQLFAVQEQGTSDTRALMSFLLFGSGSMSGSNGPYASAPETPTFTSPPSGSRLVIPACRSAVDGSDRTIETTAPMETRTSVIAALLFSIAAAADPNGPAATSNEANSLLAQVNAGSRSMAATGFEENKGQVRTTAGEPAPYVRYRLGQGNTSIFLLGNAITYQFNRTYWPEGYAELVNERLRDPEKEKQLDALRKEVRLETYRMDMVLEGADPDARISSEGRSSDYTNYYTHDALDVHSYARITYHDVYPGIDWVVYTTEQGIKYDFVVHPGADPSRIQLRFKDHEELRMDEEGRLIHGNRMGRFTEEKPVSFQNGKEVSTRFQLNGDLLTFALESYDPTRILTIDPARIWGTYYGGTSADYGRACAVDPSGNVYLAGGTHSSSGIASGGHQNTYAGIYPEADAYLVKFNPAGTRLWGTYYGGSEYEMGFSCAVDPSGNVYLAGETYSHSGIASGGYQNSWGGSVDAFLVKFDPAGTRLWSSYYGGTSNDPGYSCAVDTSGNVYLAGYTLSHSDIASGGHDTTFAGVFYTDAFLVKFDPAGTRLWGTYYGGTGSDEGNSCAVDPSGNVYLAGFTMSSSDIAGGGHQNALGGFRDAFLVKFDPAGIRLWGTYCGGTGDDQAWSSVADPSGNVYLAGYTGSFTGIASGGHQNTIGGVFDAFLVKFDQSGTRLWGSYYGGTGSDLGNSCAVDANGNVYLAGDTWSSTGIANGGHQNTQAGESDAFLVKFDPAGIRQWGTYYGGTDYDYGRSCAVDPGGNVYLAGRAESLSGIASGGHLNTIGGNVDGFLVKFEGDIGTNILGGAGTFAPIAFPNPNSGLLTVTTTRCGQRYTVCDVAGRPVLEGVLSAQDNQVDLSSQPAGVYLLTVFGTAGNEVVRVVKQ